MQREIYTEDEFGRRSPGSARLREVVKDRSAAWAREFPLLHAEDYDAVLSNLAR
jgi:hypothetical protein